MYGMRNIRQLTTLVGVCALSVVLVSNTAFADRCPRYARADRKAVQTLFASHTPGDGFQGVSAVLFRLGNIAYLGSVPPPLVELGLNTHRAAMENEYQALVQALDWLGNNPSVRVRRRTRVFLSKVVSSENLGLTGTTLTGPTEEEARENANEAVEAVGRAVARLWKCF